MKGLIFFSAILIAGISMTVNSGLAQEGKTQVDSLANEGFIGISMDAVIPRTVQRLKLPVDRGVLIANVIPNTPAAKAGLRKDDVIIRLNGLPAESALQVQRSIRKTSPGQTVHLTVFRKGQEIELMVTVGRRVYVIEDFIDRMSSGSSSYIELHRKGLILWGTKTTEEERKMLGGDLMTDINSIMVEPPNLYWTDVLRRIGENIGSMKFHQMAAIRGLTTDEFIEMISRYVIEKQEREEVVRQLGLKRGDVILAVDGKSVRNHVEAMRIYVIRDKTPVKVQVLRSGKEMELMIQVKE